MGVFEIAYVILYSFCPGFYLLRFKIVCNFFCTGDTSAVIEDERCDLFKEKNISDIISFYDIL
jgi:hypothetical protein